MAEKLIDWEAKLTSKPQESEGVSASSSGGGSSSSSSSEEDGDETSENVKVNDPEKNKKLAEITMSEELRDTYKLTLKIPRILKGLHTNQFFFMDVNDTFYETNYPTLISKIADKKFGRYAGFEYGRFFVDEVKESGGMKGWSMEITLNPIPPSLATYSKMQQEAEKALIQAMNDEAKYQGTDVSSGGGGGLTQVSGEDCSETFGISTRGFDIDATANHIIGNSSANYAVDTANMSAKDAIMDVYNRFSYSGYSDNRTCPQKMWNKSGTIRGNCADISRLVMCVGQVHGLKVGIRHCPNHYYNLIEFEGKDYRFDCCFKSSGHTSAAYGGELCNNLSMNGGPWS